VIGVAVVVAGGAVGGGIAMMVASAVPSTPTLESALAQLRGTPAADPSAPRGAGPLADLARSLGLQRLSRDLELIGDTPESLALRKVAFALLGLLFPPVLGLAMAAIGVSLPLVIPAVAGLGLAVLLSFAPDLDVRRRAAAARSEARRAVSIYLELVALERVADAGTAEALRRAADIGDGSAFAQLRESLLRAQLAGHPSWQGLSELSERLLLPELDDVADIMRASGEDGAAVYATLRARAASLRGALLAEEAAAANAASEHMIVPVALLGVAFMALLGYPAFARILFG
jgi:hypothetical protein